MSNNQACGDNAAMREALQQALYFLRRHHTGAVYASDGETLIFCEDVAKVVDAALSAPARNCDVGTAEEQRKRFNEFCEKGQHTGKACCGGCPIVTEGWREKVGASCELAWAQMAYKEDED